MKTETDSIIQSPERIQRMTDIVFAVSMVLFIISGMMSFNDPSYWAEYDKDPSAFIINSISELVTAFLVFLFIALYWVTNYNQSKYMARVDQPYIWINVLYLFFIALSPFTNILSMQFGDDIYVQLFFNLDMFFIGLFAFLSWYYASHNHRLLYKGITKEQIKTINQEMTVEPLVAVLATVVTFINTGYWELSMLLLPVGIVIVSVLSSKRKKKIAAN